MLKRKPKKDMRATWARLQRACRARKLNKQRAENEIFYRNLLQKFFEARELLETDWVSVDEFYSDSIFPILDQESFVSSLRSLGDVIESSAVHVNGEKIAIIKPKFFIKGESNG